MKYMGSKSRIAKDILKVILTPHNNYSRWVEPFAGGMNMIDKVPDYIERVANDSNPYLIAMFKALKDGWIPPDNVTKEFYEECKQGNCEDHVRGWVGFNCSYSGKYFGGYAGITQTKQGVRDYQLEAKRNVMKQIQNLRNVEFVHGSYMELDLNRGDVVYCDPPYTGTTKYFTDFNHDVFWEWVREKSKFCKVYVSEYTAPDDFYCVWSKELKSSLSANGISGGNKTSVEKLFTIKE